MSLIEDSALRNVTGITDEDRRDVSYFLQGAIYCWCKNRPDEWFALRDLMGGDNTYWKGSPLMSVYKKHSALTDEQAFKAAAKDAGWLLKQAIVHDRRAFDTTKSGLVRKYKWRRSETST
jgi:hypothetical protein